MGRCLWFCHSYTPSALESRDLHQGGAWSGHGLPYVELQGADHARCTA